MSLPKKGSRTIEVEGSTYPWRIRKKPTYSQMLGWSSMLVGIQRIEPLAVSVLVVNCAISRSDNALSPHQTGITPVIVRDMIGEAIKAGWRPETSTSFAHDYPVVMDSIGLAHRHFRRA